MTKQLPTCAVVDFEPCRAVTFVDALPGFIFLALVFFGSVALATYLTNRR